MARIQINVEGLNQALSGPGVERELMRIAERVAAEAEATAPFKTGVYSANIRPAVVGGWVRPRGKVYANAPHSMDVESRTGNLAKALGRAGG